MIKKIAAFLLLFFCLTTLEAKPLRLVLDWLVNPDHAPIFVAKQQGYFKQAGLEINIIAPANSADPLKLVAAKQADIAITYEPQLIAAVDQGLPLIRIGTLIDSPLDCLIVLANGPIKTIKDLKGKSIAYSATNLNNAILNGMLAYHGLSIEDIELVNMGYGETQALLSGRVNAAAGQMRNFEVIEMQLAGKPARVFYPENNGVPPYEELIFITNTQSLRDPRLKKFINAVTKGTLYLKQHPDESWRTFSIHHPELNNELNRQAWKVTLPYFANNPGAYNAARYETFALFMQKQKIIRKALPADRYGIEYQ